jgi:hypothetical protein
MNVSQERKALDLKAAVIIAIHGIVGWALCGSIVMIGREFWPMDTTLIIHAIGAPIIAGGLSLIYFNFFNYTSPLQTAAIFVGIAILMDLVVVALLIEKSFEMFASLIGTWIPWALMFISTYLVGSQIAKRKDTVVTI